MRRNGYLWTSGVNLDTAVRFPDPDVLSECKISAIWWRFPLIFFILYGECPPYFYFRFVWPTDPESIPHALTPRCSTSIIPKKFERDMTIHCRVIVFLSPDTSRDLVTLTFDLLNLNSWRTWLVTWPTLQPSLKTLCLFVLELWVISFPFGYLWKYVRGHCACVESRDPWVAARKRLHFWNPQPRFAYSLYNVYWATTTIKRRLLSSGVTNAKAVACVNFCAWLCDLDLWPFDLEQL